MNHIVADAALIRLSLIRLQYNHLFYQRAYSNMKRTLRKGFFLYSLLMPHLLKLEVVVLFLFFYIRIGYFVLLLSGALQVKKSASSVPLCFVQGPFLSVD